MAISNIVNINSVSDSDKLYAPISSVGQTVLVSGVPNKSIEVLGYLIVSSGNSVVNFMSNSKTLTGDMIFPDKGGASVCGGTFKTNVGESLVLNSTSYVGGHLTYNLI